MDMIFEDTVLTRNGMIVEAFFGFPNRNFTVLLKEPNGERRLRLYDEKGELKCQILGVEQGHDSLPTAVFLKEDAYLCGTLRFDKKRNRFLEGYISIANEKCYSFDNAHLLRNGWLDIRMGKDKKLLDDMFQVKASSYVDVTVCNMGFATVNTPVDMLYDRWSFYLLDGYGFRQASNVKQFVGDGYSLVSESGNEMIHEIYDFGGQRLMSMPIKGVDAFANGNFVLTTVDDCMRLYTANGQAVSPVVRDVTFLPSGQMIAHDGKLFQGLYSKQGLLSKDMVYGFEKAEHYYLLTTETESGALYDEAGDLLGTGYVLLKSGDGFAVFFQKKNGKIFLANANGFVHDAQKRV